MFFFLPLVLLVDPPGGGLSPLAWTLISVLAGTLTTVTTVLWKDRSKVYDDLKACNATRAAAEEELLALLKVLRIQLESSKGGKR